MCVTSCSMCRLKRRSDEATKRRSDEATKRRSDEATKRRSDEATKRRSDEATKRRSDENAPPLTGGTDVAADRVYAAGARGLQGDDGAGDLPARVLDRG